MEVCFVVVGGGEECVLWVYVCVLGVRRWAWYTDHPTRGVEARGDQTRTHRSDAASFRSQLHRALFSSSERGERLALDLLGREPEP